MFKTKLISKVILLFELCLVLVDCKVILNSKSVKSDEVNEHDSSELSNPCLLESEHGPCFGTFTRFYFDKNENKCKVFTYGGCNGNDNQFLTLEECQFTCIENKWPPFPIEDDSGEKNEKDEHDLGILIYNPSLTSEQEILNFESEEDIHGWVAHGIDIVEEESPPETTTVTTTSTTSTSTTTITTTTPTPTTTITTDGNNATSIVQGTTPESTTSKRTSSGGTIITTITTKQTTSISSTTTKVRQSMREITTMSSEVTTDFEDDTGDSIFNFEEPENPENQNHVLVPNIDGVNGTLERIVTFTDSISVTLEFSLKVTDYHFKLNDPQNDQNSWIYVELISNRPECNDTDQLEQNEEERIGKNEATKLFKSDFQITTENLNTDESTTTFPYDDDEKKIIEKREEIIPIVKRSGESTSTTETNIESGDEEETLTTSNENPSVGLSDEEDGEPDENVLPDCKDLNFAEERFELFDLNKYGLQFNEMSDWSIIRFAFGSSSIKRGNYTLRFTLRLGTGNLYIDNITLTIFPKMKNNTELYEEWLMTSTTTTTHITTTTGVLTDMDNSTTLPDDTMTTTTTTTTTSKGSNDTSNSPFSGDDTMSASTSQIVLIVLLVIVSVALVGLSFKHWQTQAKLREYRVNRATS